MEEDEAAATLSEARGGCDRAEQRVARDFVLRRLMVVVMMVV